METQLKILNVLSKIKCRQVLFAGNKIPPPLMAFAVHFSRLTVPVSGSYHTELEHQRKIVDLHVKPGQAVFIPPNCWDKPDMEQPCETLHFLFGKQHTGISLVTGGPEVNAIKIALPHTPAGPEQRILDAILELQRINIPFAAFHHLIMALLKCYEAALKNYDKPISKQVNTLFQDICGYIQENFHRDLSRESVARHYDISPNHLSRVFKTNGHMKFCDYVNYVRINRAKFLLQNYDLPLYHIAARCGFNDVVYFCRIFKKITKKTAKEYQSRLLYDKGR